MRNILLMLSLLVLLCGCGKKNKLNGPYTFENQTGETINLRMYKTVDDYASSSNPTLAVRMAPGDSYQWNYTDPDEMLQKDKTFYMDWYSDDYTLSNWTHFVDRSQAALVEEEFPHLFTRKRYGTKTCVLLPRKKSHWRQVAIGGNEKEALWKAVDILAWQKDSSVWKSLTSAEQHCELLISKTCMSSIRIGSILATNSQVLFYDNLPYGGQQFLLVQMVQDTAQKKRSATIYHRSSIASGKPDTIRLTLYPYDYILTRHK